MLFEFECPKCKGSLCELHSEDCTDSTARSGFHQIKHSPAWAINELAFGQRMPQVFVICKSCTDSSTDRSYVHCPHCDVFHNGRIFDPFGNWHGLVCPNCGGTIPAIENTTAALLRKIAKPFYKSAQPQKISAYIEKKRLSQRGRQLLLANPNTSFKKPNYALMGFLFGGAMFLVSMIFVGAAAVIFELEMQSILWTTALTLLANMAGGALFGIGMYFSLEKKGNPELHLNVREMIEKKDNELLTDEQSDTQEA